VAILFRIGIGDKVNAELEGFAWHSGSTPRFPARDYFDFTFGGAASLVAWRRADDAIVVGVHYHQLLNLDQSTVRHDKRSQQLAAAVVARHSVRLARQRADVWVGPALVVDRIFDYPGDSASVRRDSARNFGAAAGAAVLVHGRFRVSGQFTFANYWQGQGGISVIL